MKLKTKTIEKFKKTKSCFFEGIDKISRTDEGKKRDDIDHQCFKNETGNIL